MLRYLSFYCLALMLLTFNFIIIEKYIHINESYETFQEHAWVIFHPPKNKSETKKYNLIFFLIIKFIMINAQHLKS